MKYASKLNLRIPDVAKQLRRNTKIIGADGWEEEIRIFRRYVTRAESEQILSIFHPKIAEAVKFVFISNIGTVAAHVHTEEECVINLYIEASNAKTVFYEGVVVPIKDHEWEGKTYFGADKSLLTPAEHFEAASGDIWVLNTSQPHAVVAEDGFENRWAVQIYLSMPFNETLKYANAE
jgi:hypothetical protein